MLNLKIVQSENIKLESKIPFPVCKTYLVQVIRWAKNLDATTQLYIETNRKI